MDRSSGGITQEDVARRAGVSARTVSNVVNGFHYVAAETRARVQAAMHELGYQPNRAAQNLRHGRSGTLALVLPLNVPYFAELTEFIVDAARKHSYLVMIDKTDGDPDQERELIIGTERAGWFDGMVFGPSGLTEADLRTRATSFPIVLLGKHIRDSHFDHVQINNVAASRAATRHLVDLGRRRIAVIGRHEGQRRDVGYDRTHGYRRALREAGRQIDPDLMVAADGFRRDAGAEAMSRLLELPKPPDAVFCYNDPLALGAMRAAIRRGLRIPEDIAIVGFDDSEDGQYSTPTLTTISQDKAQIAQLAVDLLVSRMRGDASPPVTRHARWRLIVRESTIGA